MMTTHDKVQYIHAQLRHLTETLGMEAAVIVLQSSKGVLCVRWPPCEPSCPHPDACSGHAYAAASEILDHTAERMFGDD